MSENLPPAPPPPPPDFQPPYGQQPGQPYGQHPGYGYPQYPAGGDLYGSPQREAELQLDAHGLRPQQRWTVLIRLILAIPQLIILYFLWVAGFFVLVVGWFAALFTGQLPEGIRDFLIGILRYQVRVHGYLFLLVDEYPPFVFFDAPDYPIQIEVPPPTRLNPLAVLFRLILIIPAAIISGVVMDGAIVVSIVVWVMMLFTGRQPEPAFGATSAGLRYQMRFLAFTGMLTPTYPKGLFGEPGATADRTSPTHPLLLSSSARTLLIVMIVLGVLVAIFGNGNSSG